MLEQLPYIKKFLAWVTYRKVAMAALGGVIWIFSLTLFENRHEFWNKDEHALPRPIEHIRLKVKDKMSVRLRVFVDSNRLVNFVSVASANIRLNEADTVFWHTDDPVISFELNDAIAKNGSVRPLFTTDDNYNASVVRTINAEFSCYENKGLLGPNITARIPYICRISVPPHYGQFTGFITIGLNEKPTQDQTEEVRRVLSDISSNIFFDNINR